MRTFDTTTRRLRSLVLVAAMIVGSGQAVAAATGPAPRVDKPLSNDDRECRGRRLPTPGSSRAACTHGPDPAPRGVDASVPYRVSAETTAPSATRLATTAPAAVPCYGDGTSGSRVQAVYTYPADRADRYAQVVGSIRRWAAEVDHVVNESARQTGGVRHVRFVADADCTLSVLKVRLSPVGDDTIENTIAELAAQGHNRRDRKYLVWNDSTVLCGIAATYVDDSRGTGNANDGNAPGQVGRIDSGCWGLASRGQSIETHELLHTLGAVQPTAPHATELGHCTDDADRMCYDDGSPGIVMTAVCGSAQEALLDCRNDDYFSTAPPAGSYLARYWNTADSSFLARSAPDPADAAPAPTPPPAEPEPALPLPLDRLTGGGAAAHELLTPARLLDTRNGTGGRRTALGSGQSYAFPATGAGGVPAAGVGGVVLNVTVTGPSAAGALTVWPAGAARPAQPSIHFTPGMTRPVAVTVPVGEGGRVSVHNTAGNVHVVADVVAWYDDGGGTATSAFAALAPTRLLDTRIGNGGRRTPLGAAETFALQVSGRGGVPASGVEGVVLNVTVTAPTTSGFVTTFPTGAARPVASSLNFVRGETVPNLVVVRVGSTGKVSLFNSSGQTHLVADVVGWFDDGAGAATARYVPRTPVTVLDTRDGVGSVARPLSAGESVAVDVVTDAGLPAQTASGVVLAVTTFTPTGASYLTVYPDGATRPTASNLNYVKSVGASNLVFVPVGADGSVRIYQHSATAHVRAVVVGWFDES